MIQGNKIVVSVANCYGFDPSTGNMLFAALTNVSNAFDITMAATDVRGSKNNALIFRYMHDREVKLEMVSATFNRQILALNVGSAIEKLTNAPVLTEGCLDFTAGVATMVGTPIGDIVSVIFEDGTVENCVVTSEKKVTLKDTTFNGSAKIAYTTSIASVESVTISTVTPPSVIRMVIIGDVIDSATGQVVENLNIEVPRFQIDGNYNLAFAADGTSQDKLTGSALKTSGVTCAEGDGYAFVQFIPVTPTVPAA